MPRVFILPYSRNTKIFPGNPLLNKRILILLIPFLLFITFPIWKIPVASFLTPRGVEENKAKEPNKQPSKDFVMSRIKIIQNQEGRKTAVIRAKEAITGNNVNEIHLQSVEADFWDEENNITKVAAETGSYNVISELLTLKKNVVIKRQEEDHTMYTNHLVYSGKEKTVVSPEKTRFVGDNFNIVGNRLDYDLNTGRYRLSNRIHCIIGGTLAP